MIGRLNHVAIAVKDMHAAAAVFAGRLSNSNKGKRS
jgi:hypothetical protein